MDHAGRKRRGGAAGSLVSGDGIVGAALRLVQIAEIVEHLVRLRIELERGLERGDRRIDVARLLERVAEIHVRGERGGVERLRSPIRRDRIVDAAEPQPGGTEIGPGRGVVRRERDCGIEPAQRVAVVAGFECIGAETRGDRGIRRGSSQRVP